ncbi:MAG: hypothetical protein KC609_06550 [Myxococcales bacterium]|nr:hypothetical protein [Myxococcales bacterium]
MNERRTSGTRHKPGHGRGARWVIALVAALLLCCVAPLAAMEPPIDAGRERTSHRLHGRWRVTELVRHGLSQRTPGGIVLDFDIERGAWSMKISSVSGYSIGGTLSVDGDQLVLRPANTRRPVTLQVSISSNDELTLVEVKSQNLIMAVRMR